MALQSDFREYFIHTIGVKRLVSRDSAGKPTFGATESHACYIRDDVKVWRWEGGTEAQSRRTIYVETPVGNHDQITLPVGYEPQVVTPLWVVRHADKDGFHHSEVYVS